MPSDSWSPCTARRHAARRTRRAGAVAGGEGGAGAGSVSCVCCQKCASLPLGAPTARRARPGGVGAGRVRGHSETRDHTPCAVFDVIKGGRVGRRPRVRPWCRLPTRDSRAARRRTPPRPPRAPAPGPPARPAAVSTRARNPEERARPARPFNDVCGLWSILELDESPSTPHRQRPAARCGTWRLPAVPTTTRLAPPLSVRRQRVPLASQPSPWSGLAVSK